MRVLLPEGWAPAIGYANGIEVEAGRIIFVAGQVGWDAQQKFHSEEIPPQFDQALSNILAVLAEAGAGPEHICRITAFCCDKPAYMASRRELGPIWRKHMGTHYPAMSMIFVSDLLDNPGKIELEATAVVPRRSLPGSGNSLPTHPFIVRAAPRVTLVVARARNGVIGADNRLPWHLPEDLRHFRDLTMGHTIVMGRRTWESIGRALPGRRSIVISQADAQRFPGAECAPSLEDALALAAQPAPVAVARAIEGAGIAAAAGSPAEESSEVFVIGGAQLFQAALPLAGRAVVTEIDRDYEGDTRFDALDPCEWSIFARTEHLAASGMPYSIVDYRRIPTVASARSGPA